MHVFSLGNVMTEEPVVHRRQDGAPRKRWDGAPQKSQVRFSFSTRPATHNRRCSDRRGALRRHAKLAALRTKREAPTAVLSLDEARQPLRETPSNGSSFDFAATVNDARNRGATYSLPTISCHSL